MVPPAFGRIFFEPDPRGRVPAQIYEVEIFDLLIETGSDKPVQYAKKLAFRSELKCRIGDQKIDVLFAMPNDERPIILDVKRKMIRL
jgi:hypothetical protein